VARSSRIVLERNPGYREERYDEKPPAGDAEAVAIAAAGRAARADARPRGDRIIEEQQPRWLAFLNGEHDLLDRLPNEFAPNAASRTTAGAEPGQAGHPHGRSPLVARPVRPTSAWRSRWSAATRPSKVALRRAMAPGLRRASEIELVRRGQAMPGAVGDRAPAVRATTRR
jgi:hypothetical protein